MRVVNHYRQQINQFICASTPGAFLAAWGLLLVALACLSGVFAYVGAPAMNGRAWDTPLYLDGAWRIANGQVPHRDFYSCLGALTYYVTWLGMKMSRPCVSAITYGNILVLVALGVSAMAVLKRRTSALYAGVMSLFLALLAVAPRPLGDPYDYTDYAMLYNRYGEAFLGLLGAIFFLPPLPGPGRRWGDRAETAFAGVLWMLLLFCKMNYFVLALGFFGLACLFRRFSAGQVLLFFLSAVLFFGLVSFATHIPASAILRDYRTSAGVTDLWQRLHAVAAHGIENVLYLPVLALLLWELASQQGGRIPSPRAFWKPLLLVAVLFGSALLLVSSDCQEGEMPLLALAGFYCAEMIRRDTVATRDDSMLMTTRNLGALALFGILFVPTLGTDCKCVIFAARDAITHNWVSTDTLRSTNLSDWRFKKNGTRFSEMQGCMDDLDDGIQLLRRHADPHMRLTAWMFANPYHLALGLVPAEGGLIDLGDASVVKKSHPPLKWLVGNATHILADDDTTRIKDAYGPEWDALHLEVVEQTKHFTLFKVPVETRKNP